MADIRSALADHAAPGRHGTPGQAPGVVLREVSGAGLVQVAAWPDTVGAAMARLAELAGIAAPETTRIATAGTDVTLFRLAPERFWIAGAAADRLREAVAGAFAPEEAVVTDLGHSRTVLRVSGPEARAFLARSIAIDLDPAIFPLHSVAQTALHHVGVLVHFAAGAPEGDAFDLYIPRSFALSHWHWLTHLAEPFGYEVREALAAASG